jgi:PKD repeat protein
VAVGSPIEGEGTFTDTVGSNFHVAVWDWGDGSQCITGPDNNGCNIDEVSRTVSGSHTYTLPGVYTVRLTVIDHTGNASTWVYQYVVVYDGSQGFVTGGGWIDSPAGAYAADPALTGRANFGFVSRYKKGASAPSGTTAFRFRAGNLNFYSDSYEWLVVAGAKAMFKGVGTINDAGSYGFLLSAIDADLTRSTDVDLFRIKIWDRDNGDSVVYDNQMGAEEDADPTTALGGGSIVVHKGK